MPRSWSSLGHADLTGRRRDNGQRRLVITGAPWLNQLGDFHSPDYLLPWGAGRLAFVTEASGRAGDGARDTAGRALHGPAGAVVGREGLAASLAAELRDFPASVWPVRSKGATSSYVTFIEDEPELADVVVALWDVARSGSACHSAYSSCGWLRSTANFEVIGLSGRFPGGRPRAGRRVRTG